QWRGPGELSTLDEFASQKGAITYKDERFQDIWLEAHDPKEGMARVIQRIKRGGGRISFNMKNFDPTNALDKSISSEKLTLTEYEYRYIKEHPEIEAITKFEPQVGG